MCRLVSVRRELLRTIRGPDQRGGRNGTYAIVVTMGYGVVAPND
jgi:hypothetical protein